MRKDGNADVKDSNEKSQHDHLKELAKELKCDKAEAAFDAAVKNLSESKPLPKHEPKKHTPKGSTEKGKAMTKQTKKVSLWITGLTKTVAETLIGPTIRMILIG